MTPLQAAAAAAAVLRAPARSAASRRRRRHRWPATARFEDVDAATLKAERLALAEHERLLYAAHLRRW